MCIGYYTRFTKKRPSVKTCDCWCREVLNWVLYNSYTIEDKKKVIGIRRVAGLTRS
jgi:hypothetical protein